MSQRGRDPSPASALRPPVEQAPPAEGTVDKAIDVLFALRAAGEPRGVTALGRALGLPKSSAHRLLQSLCRRGLVERDEGGRYRLGMALVALGVGVLEREPVVAAARPVLEEEAASLGETFFLVAARGGRLVVLDKAEGTGFLRASPQVGAEVPVHATAAGKLYLALDPEQLGTAADAELERFTERTPVTPTALRREVARARRSGVAINRDEWIDGLTVTAAPVWLRERMAGAVALAAPSARARELGAEALEARVAAASERVSQRLAGVGGAVGAGPRIDEAE